MKESGVIVVKDVLDKLERMPVNGRWGDEMNSSGPPRAKRQAAAVGGGAAPDVSKIHLPGKRDHAMGKRRVVAQGRPDLACAACAT